mmetsp:Transcript_12193/g.21545  ORF Transcript_12193/g.21545 Transcript_12193/m.21545 type:complete len:111 (+) Transcript_12193:149-481(+)
MMPSHNHAKHRCQFQQRLAICTKFEQKVTDHKQILHQTWKQYLNGQLAMLIQHCVGIQSCIKCGNAGHVIIFIPKPVARTIRAVATVISSTHVNDNVAQGETTQSLSILH